MITVPTWAPDGIKMDNLSHDISRISSDIAHNIAMPKRSSSGGSGFSSGGGFSGGGSGGGGGGSW